MMYCKLLAFSAALAICTSTLCIPKIAIAANDDANNNVTTQDTTPPQTSPFRSPGVRFNGWSPDEQRMHMMPHYGAMKGMPNRTFPMWNLGLTQNKNLTADEAKTITEAALLMFNRRDLKVGDITPKTMRGRDFYIIQLVDEKGNIASVVMLDKDTGSIRPLPKHP